jgi:4-hydroxybenzoate polyprenyltransferase
MPAARNGLWSYLQLVRPANVVTAFADVLAGYGVALSAADSTSLGPPRLPGPASALSLVALLVATGCLYAGGVAFNDFFDRDVDAVERPERPIPSGAVPAAQAAWLGSLLIAAGIFAAAQVNLTAAAAAILVAVLAIAYDSWLKRTPVGPICMASCRAVNLVLGMSAVPAAIGVRWPLALLVAGYIGAVTFLSRGEVHGGSRSTGALCALVMTGVVLVVAWLGLSQPSPVGTVISLLLTAWLGWRVVPAFWRAFRRADPSSIRAAVRTGVLSLILLDAALASACAGPVYGVVVLALLLPAQLLARMFAVT